MMKQGFKQVQLRNGKMGDLSDVQSQIVCAHLASINLTPRLFGVSKVSTII